MMELKKKNKEKNKCEEDGENNSSIHWIPIEVASWRACNVPSSSSQSPYIKKKVRRN